MTIEKLEHLSLLQISGDDALSFLQGQLTNDINLANDQWQYSGYCNPKGRLLGLFTLWQSEKSAYVVIDKSLTEALVKRLTMYVMRSKVDIKVTDMLIYGATDTTSLNALNLEIDTQGLTDEVTVLSNQDTHLLNLGGHRYLIATKKNVPSSSIIEKKNSQWHAYNINQGLPEVTATSSELFIPQMVNLDILNGINFKKGCYTGQEIVARMHYLGKLKQRMFVCTVNNLDTEILNGDKVFSDPELGKSVGNIVSINETTALAVLRMDDLDQKFWLTANASLSVQSNQPYSLEGKSQN